MAQPRAESGSSATSTAVLPGVYEVGFKDGGGKQRWRTVAGGITAARALRDELLARRGRGERVVAGRSAALRRCSGQVAGRAGRWIFGLGRRSATATRSSSIWFLAFGARRLDAISPDELALLVREMRRLGFSESTIVIVARRDEPRLPLLGTPARLDAGRIRSL